MHDICYICDSCCCSECENLNSNGNCTIYDDSGSGVCLSIPFSFIYASTDSIKTKQDIIDNPELVSDCLLQYLGLDISESNIINMRAGQEGIYLEFKTLDNPREVSHIAW